MSIIYVKKECLANLCQNATNPSTNNHCYQHQQFFSVIQKKNYMFVGKRVNYSQARHRQLIILVFISSVLKSKSDLLFLYLTCNSPSLLVLYWLHEKFLSEEPNRTTGKEIQAQSGIVKEAQQDLELSFNHV